MEVDLDVEVDVGIMGGGHYVRYKSGVKWYSEEVELHQEGCITVKNPATFFRLGEGVNIHVRVSEYRCF